MRIDKLKANFLTRQIQEVKLFLKNPGKPVRILNLNTGETYTGRLPITGNHQIYLPTEICKMLEGAELIRIQLL